MLFYIIIVFILRLYILYVCVYVCNGSYLLYIIAIFAWKDNKYSLNINKEFTTNVTAHKGSV